MKPEQREVGHAAVTFVDDDVGDALQFVDAPRLPPDFGDDPAGLVGDVGKRRAEHQDPEHAAPREQRAAPEQERRRGRGSR